MEPFWDPLSTDARESYDLAMVHNSEICAQTHEAEAPGEVRVRIEDHLPTVAIPWFCGNIEC